MKTYSVVLRARALPCLSKTNHELNFFFFFLRDDKLWCDCCRYASEFKCSSNDSDSSAHTDQMANREFITKSQSIRCGCKEEKKKRKKTKPNNIIHNNIYVFRARPTATRWTKTIAFFNCFRFSVFFLLFFLASRANLYCYVLYRIFFLLFHFIGRRE